MSNYIDCSNEQTKQKVIEIINNLRRGVKIANDMGISNLLYNEAYVDLLIAAYLGHKYNIETQGADAQDKDGNLMEYKCVAKKDGKYTGSFQFHWLSKEKIDKYEKCRYFYFVWRAEMSIEKIICIETKTLMPEIKKKAGKRGSTAGHKSFSCGTVEKLVKKGKAKIIFEKK